MGLGATQTRYVFTTSDIEETLGTNNTQKTTNEDQVQETKDTLSTNVPEINDEAVISDEALKLFEDNKN